MKIRMINSTSNRYKYSVMCNNWLSSEFEVTGVREGFMLSPLLFLVVLDWVLRKTTGQRKNGIPRRNQFEQVEELHFADDTCVMSQSLLRPKSHLARRP